MDKLLAVLATALVGGLIAFQPPVNAGLARSVTVLGAAFVSTGISSVVLLVIVLVTGTWRHLGGVADVSVVYLIGGLLGAILVTVSLITVTSLGAGGVVAATVCGQLTLSLVIDRFGLLGLAPIEVTPQRLLGVALLLAGTVLVTFR
jgi:transporter family-2 protein